MNNFIPYGRQSISDKDIESVIEVLKSDYLTQGPVVPQFEEEIASYCGAKHAVAVNSATSALHIACLALGLGKGDYLWTSPITFVASANSALYCGAKVDFVDIDPGTVNMSPKALEEKLKVAEKENRLPKIVMPVHFGGLSCDMEKIYELSKEFGFKIIEDASHGIGGSYQGIKIGACQYSDITVFSFHPVKIITSGEGGMAMTNDRFLADQMSLLRSHCVTRDEELMKCNSDGSWYYEQLGLGYNYRLTDIQAALGLSQISRLDQFVKKRNELALEYQQQLSELLVKWQEIPSNSDSAYHLFIITLDKNLDRKFIFEKMREENIGVNVHYIPVYRQPYFQRFGFSNGDFLNAEKYYQSCMTLPLSPQLSKKDFMRVVSKLREILKR